MVHCFNNRTAAMDIFCLSSSLNAERKIPVAYILRRQRPLSMSLRKYICCIFRHQMEDSIDILVSHRTVDHDQVSTCPFCQHTFKL